MKKLNRKGFTLIELLAVIVILAVVMGIAASNVLSSINNSRKSSLVSSAQSAALTFQNKYSEALLTNTANVTLKSGSFGGYNFTQPATTTAPYHYIMSGANSKAELNLASSNYSLSTATSAVAGTKSTGSSTTPTDMTSSFVVFNGSDMTVCLLVPSTSSFYVNNAALSADETILIYGKYFKISKDVMFACSDEQKSW